MDIIVNIPAVNAVLLDQQLQIIGADYQGMSTNPNTDPDTLIIDRANPVQVRVHLDDAASQAEQDQATAIVQKHDPTQLTADQQAAQQAAQQMATVSAELGTLITQVNTLSGTLKTFKVAADPTALAAALNALIPQIGTSMAVNAQIMTALQLLLQQQGR